MVAGVALGATPIEEGHWLKVKGELQEGGTFEVKSVEIVQPERKEVLIGDVVDVSPSERSFTVLDQKITVSEKTSWKETSFDEILGKRVRVKGYYRGPHRFSARTISLRGKGRDRIEGRCDEANEVVGGVEVLIMKYRLFIPEDLPVETERPLSDYELAPPRSATEPPRERDEDDLIPGWLRIGEKLTFGLRLELKSRKEKDFNLDASDEEDRADHLLGLRGELSWRPRDDIYALAGFSAERFRRDDDEEGRLSKRKIFLTESFIYLKDLPFEDLDLQVGRQDFDETREWLYDRNLDALRLILSKDRLRLELSASTVLTDGHDRDEETDNFILYASNNDPKRRSAAYVILRESDSFGKERTIHIGGRLLGRWLPRNDCWVEMSHLRGRSDGADLEAFALDVGTVWSPKRAGPFHFSVGYAFGSGDGDPNDGTDRSFRQTGLHDNNAKMGSVTSFRYYGELFEPELSNMSIFTVGTGVRIKEKTSIDLVFHKYDQVRASEYLRKTELDLLPDGAHEDLGWELDLVVGSRLHESWELELVAARFFPGSAFAGADGAFMARGQIRFRF